MLYAVMLSLRACCWLDACAALCSWGSHQAAGDKDNSSCAASMSTGDCCVAGLLAGALCENKIRHPPRPEVNAGCMMFRRRWPTSLWLLLLLLPARRCLPVRLSDAGYVVCNYSPPGNFGGPADYRVNVQPARRRRAALSATAATAAAVNVEAGTTP